MKIKLIHNSEIDHSRWNRCISKSLNGNFYALAWYLDIVSPDWEALIEGDYHSVMPLPLLVKRRKKVITTPPYAWQLGIFSNSIMDQKMILRFIDRIPEGYRLSNINLNKFNRSGKEELIVEELSSFELDLISPYEKLRKKYKDTLVNRLNTNPANRLSITRGISLSDFLEFISRFDRFNPRRISKNKLPLIRMITSGSIRYRLGELFGAYSAENNLSAVLFIIRFRQRSTIFFLAADHEGLRAHGPECLIDEYVKLNADQKLTLSVDDPGNRKTRELFELFDGEICRFSRIKGRQD